MFMILVVSPESFQKPEFTNKLPGGLGPLRGLVVIFQLSVSLTYLVTRISCLLGV